MKKVYVEPELVLELYTLDASIASNCEEVVSNGPEAGNHSACKDYVAPFSLYKSEPINVNFYEDTACECYTSGQNGMYWTS